MLYVLTCITTSHYTCISLHNFKSIFTYRINNNRDITSLYNHKIPHFITTGQGRLGGGGRDVRPDAPAAHQGSRTLGGTTGQGEERPSGRGQGRGGRAPRCREGEATGRFRSGKKLNKNRILICQVHVYSGSALEPLQAEEATWPISVLCVFVFKQF